MACSKCKKNKEKIDLGVDAFDRGETFFEKALVFFAKLIIFIIATPITVLIIVPFTVYLLIKALFFNSTVDVTSGLIRVGKMITGKEIEYEDDDEEFIDDDEELIETGIDE